MLKFSFIVRLALATTLSFGLAGVAFGESTPASGPAPIHGMPRILAVIIPSDRSFRVGQTIHGRVETSANVGYVEARIQYRNAPLHRDGVGVFSLAYTIPWWLPPWLRHEWTLQIIARSIDGVEVKQDLPIRVY